MAGSNQLHHRRFLLLLGYGLLSLAIVALAGCGRGKGDVSGTVRVGGKPLKGGSISFISTEEGPSFTSLIKEDGTYVCPNVLSGNYKVCVDTEGLRHQPLGMANRGGNSGSSKGSSGPPPSGRGGGPKDLVSQVKSGKIKNTPPPGSGPPEGQGKPQDGLAMMVDDAKNYVPIPPRYSKPETTDVTFTAGTGSQTFDVELKDK